MTNPSSETHRLVSVLVHDVGKYITRTARNVADGEWTPDLIAMLLDDLYDLRGERALQVFLRITPLGTRPLATYPEWSTVHAMLCELDAMESELRAGKQSALRRAQGLALSVECTLRALLLRATDDACPQHSKGQSP
jgi:hypothetical protein